MLDIFRHALFICAKTNFQDKKKADYQNKLCGFMLNISLNK
jgi:hypothetical protein